MTLEREIHPDLRDMLLANEEFEYAHLIKFERPSRPDSRTGKTSTASVRYTHLTDASRNIGFDDGSTDLEGVSNGTQTYLANKVLKVSEVSESVEAKASNFTLVLDGNGLGAEIQQQPINIVTIDSETVDLQIIDKNIDPVYEGFREGDKVELYGNSFGFFNIHSFRTNNVIRVKKIDHNLVNQTNELCGLRLASEEIKSILIDKNLPAYSSFINREVFIYKIYQQNGVIVGEPILLFKGIISNVSFEDDDNGIRVSWGLTSHWGDFAQVKGRISSDDFHRALDQNGNPQPASALKTEYAYDKGFMHSETSVNTLAKYVVQVEKQKVKAKKGFLGIGSKVKVKKYYANEDRFTELDFQLQARSIPLHYGVRITEGFPIFADTLKNDSSTVYVIYALGEGPIGAIYDVVVDDKTLICSNKGDLEARGAQTPDETVDIVCRGRADRGDVLSGTNSINHLVAPIDYYANVATSATSGSGGFLSGLIAIARGYYPYIPPTFATSGYTSTGKGIIHGESLSLTSPIDMTLDFFGGSSSQEAASQLVQIAEAQNFKIQSDYWLTEETDEYWGPNHRLLDTAYVVAKFKISEGETSIPSLEFIIKGKVLECYNYDYSYAHYEKASAENSDNFALGSTVDLYRSDTNNIINSGLQIIDKWEFVNSDGITETRFRFNIKPNLGYSGAVPSITKFYMKQSGNTWTMRTFNFIENQGIINTELSGELTPTPDDGIVTYPLPDEIIPTDGIIISQPGGYVLGGGTLDGHTLRARYDIDAINYA